MNAQKFTQKSLEAITAAQSLATEYSNMQIEQLHLLSALTREDEGLISQLLKKMGVISLPSAATSPLKLPLCRLSPGPVGNRTRSMSPPMWIRSSPPLNASPNR